MPAAQEVAPLTQAGIPSQGLASCLEPFPRAWAACHGEDPPLASWGGRERVRGKKRTWGDCCFQSTPQLSLGNLLLSYLWVPSAGGAEAPSAPVLRAWHIQDLR